MNPVPTLEEEIKETVERWVRERIFESGVEDISNASRGKWHVSENWVRCAVELALAEIDGGRPQ